MMQYPSLTATTFLSASPTMWAAVSLTAPLTSALIVGRPPSVAALNTTLTIDTGPAALIGPYDSSGFPVGCKSACEADLDGDPSESLHFAGGRDVDLIHPLIANSPNCCTGEYDTAATCPSSGVEYYSYFS